MTLNFEALAEIPAAPRRLTVYRTVALAIDGTPAEEFVPNPSYAAADSGRWATATGTLYTACTAEVTWNEFCRTWAKDLHHPKGMSHGIPKKEARRLAYLPVGPPPPARALVRLEFDLQRVADLTLQHVTQLLFAAYFDVSEMRSDEHRACAELAAAAVKLGWDAMIVPSAATDRPGQCVPIFQTGRERFIDHEVVASPASPTISHAMLSRYREHERPGWLQLV